MHAPFPDPQIVTPRMNLRLLSSHDRPEFVRVHEVSRDEILPWFPQLDEGETFHHLFDRHLQRALQGAVDDTEYRLVGHLPDGRIAGFFNLSRIVRGVFQNAYASWAVNSEVKCRGYGTEGVTALLDFAFAPPPAGLALHRVQANIIPANAPSIRVAHKCGFRLEGLARQYLKIAGQWQDHSMYAKLADEHTPTYLKPAP